MEWVEELGEAAVAPWYAPDVRAAGELGRLSSLAPDLETRVVSGRQVTDLGYLRGVGAPSTVVLTDHTKLVDSFAPLATLPSLEQIGRAHV